MQTEIPRAVFLSFSFFTAEKKSFISIDSTLPDAEAGLIKRRMAEGPRAVFLNKERFPAPQPPWGTSGNV